MLEDLLLIITFYCENNSIVYQQGMQDIFIPFVYLKSCQFSIAEVYAYTKGYIDMFMPNTLHSKFNGKDYSLPHLQCQLSLLRMLLKYHDIELYQHFKKLEIDTEAFATSWILTQFSRVVEFSLIYELIEIILFEKDKLIVLFMSIALLKHFKSQILNLKEMEFLLPFLQKKARISNMRELCKIYYESVAIRSQTPLSFAILIQKLKINDAATVISNEEIVELQDLELETFIVYPEELLLNQRQIMNCSHLYNTSNNDKSMNRLYLTGNQNKYIMSDNEREGSLCKDFQSITSINMLKRDCGNDTEIGKSVNFKIIDLSSNKKFVKCCKELIICSKIKGKKTKDVLDSCYQELKKSNILIVTSSHKQKISDKEKIKFQETLEILASLGLSRVSVLKGGAKGYRMG